MCPESYRPYFKINFGSSQSLNAEISLAVLFQVLFNDFSGALRCGLNRASPRRGAIVASKVVSSAKNWHSKFDPEPSTKVTLCRAVPRIRTGDARSLSRLRRSILPFSWDNSTNIPRTSPFEKPWTKVGAGCASLH